jgi:hypothetical protein
MVRPLAALVALASLLLIPTALHYVGLCRHRTSTRYQLKFALRHPAPATYDFSKRSDTMLITVPPDTNWTMESVFHDTPEACVTLRSTEGHWVIGSIGGGTMICHGTDCSYSQTPGNYLRYHTDHTVKPRVAAGMMVTGHTSFHHLVASLVQDADRYFALCTTPAWQRIPWYTSYLVPFVGSRFRNGMVRAALWFQLRVAYVENDTWSYEGTLPLSWYAFPPEWLEDLRWRSNFFIARAIVRSAAWMGRNLGGMHAMYEEYERF